MTAPVTAAPIDDTAFAELRASFAGDLVRPGDNAYEEHRRVWNGSIDRRPALVARCTGVADVLAVVRFARDRGLLAAVRSGGHSFPGLSTCDGGVVIDLRPMRGIRVDPGTRTARAQAGTLLGELDRETQAFGLAAPSGIVTHTGMAGLTLGGGIGWIMRKHGLSIDQLVSVDLVTASGDLVKASETENADLFWGVRGGGGNFGIVTDFEFRLVPLGPQVMAGPVFWAMEDAPEVLRFYRDWIAGGPDELMTIVVQRKAPALPVVPPELVGKRVIAVVSCHCGPVEEGERVLAPLKKFGRPVLDLCKPKPFLAHQAMFDPSFRRGCWYYVRSCDVASLEDGVIDAICEHGLRIESPITSLALWQMGGAVARVDDADSAFHGRKAGFTFNINGNTETATGFEAERQWARDFWTALEPYHTSVYVNFLMEEGEERVKQAYGEEKWARLKSLKRKYDPTNLFRVNQNIRPD
ncbi:MAG TPA: FAD-binding oxidoreductase [Candidatus Eisenbacteria bacterium]|nr:FAD-binding oxidoreductase [Candidatus Eisenbacteria bacterium]